MDKMIKQKNREIGHRVAQFRKELGLTQVEFGGLIGVSQCVLASYETGRRSIPIAMADIIAENLHVTPNDLFGLQARRPGPESALEKRIQELKKLPRAKQKTVLDMLTGVLAAAKA